MVAACTGVIWLNPMAETASRIHWASGGVRASQALGLRFVGATFPEAMVRDYAGEIAQLCPWWRGWCFNAHHQLQDNFLDVIDMGRPIVLSISR